MHVNSLAKFVSTLNIGKANRLRSIIVNDTILNKRLLSLFVNYGIILNFMIVDQGIEVFFKYKSNNNIFKKIVIIDRPGRRLSVDVIKLMKMKNKSTNEVYIVSTSLGLLFDYECFILNISGVVLLKIIL